LTGDGVDALETVVQRIAGVEHAGEDAFFARERQLFALRDAATHVDRARVHVGADLPPVELFAEELRMAQQAIASITGEFTSDDLLGEIFLRFCIGK
jgi:tRNA modification GTPase